MKFIKLFKEFDNKIELFNKKLKLLNSEYKSTFGIFNEPIVNEEWVVCDCLKILKEELDKIESEKT